MSRSRVSSRVRTVFVLLLAAQIFFCGSAVVSAADAGLTADGGAEASVEAAVDAGFGLDALKARDVRALIAGTLDVAVDPASLFDVALDDAEATSLDAARIRAFLRGARDVADASARGRVRRRDAGDAGAEAGVAVDPEAWQRLVDLASARLAFYDLGPDRTSALLAAHAKRVAAAKPKETEEQRLAREAEEQRKQALEDAKRARSEGERLVAEELARLLGLGQKLDATSRKFEAEEQAIASRQDAVLGWQRRVREAKAAAPADADATYDALRKALRATRDELDVALDSLDADSIVPSVGADPLADVPSDIDVTAERAKRVELEKLVKTLRAKEQALRWSRARQLVDESDALNRERLSLIASLSPAKRGAVTGFGDEAWDQGRAELRQLGLIVRYHRFVAIKLFGELRAPGASVGASVARSLAVLVPWAVLIAIFTWWRRRSRALLEALQARIEEADRDARLTTPSLALRGFRFLRVVRAPIEWLALFLAMVWVLPQSTQDLLEVQLFTTVVSWSLAGALVVDAINAVFAPPVTLGVSPQVVQRDEDRLRLRSLRLIGRVVVAFILILVICARLVGQGAIYSWVFSTCWLAGVPILLVLVRWWRHTVFARIERLRKKTRFQTWALANRRGWKSFLAATSAAVHLFVVGAIKVVRVWVSGFDLARRGAAYLFRRELDKLEKDREALSLTPLPQATFDALAPTQPLVKWVATSADEKLDAIRDAVREGHGGVFAIVGERGAGKSATLERLRGETNGSLVARCERAPVGHGLEPLRARLAEAAGLPVDASLERVGAHVDALDTPHGVLLDDAHVHVRMVMGGLRDFDALVAVARQHSRHAVWIMTFDDTVWQFLDRSRGVRPLFDDVVELEPWSEERLGELIDSRSADARLEASFEGLLDELPPRADEIDKQDALRDRKLRFYRLIWDHVRGNPGIALHVWRRALGLDSGGGVLVGGLEIPEADELELLPYPTLFVLRAVLQLAPASPDDVAQATHLTATEISDALRYALAHGYLVERGGRYDLTWDWLRAITRILQRRHLLVLR
jgi:flagellar biosynthesis GTPase FlhF